MARTGAQLLAECLAQLGVDRTWGEAIPGTEPTIPHVAVADPDLSCLLADAAGRVSSGYGAAFVPGGVVHLSSRPGGTAHPRPISSAEELVDTCTEIVGREVPDTVALHLDMDLTAEIPAGVTAGGEAPRGVVMQLDAAFADARVGVIAGPGVVRGGHVPGLQRFALSSGLGVFNTWGAKGVFRWDSPFHFGTIGLQALDFDLAGFDGYDLVVATGIDADESPLNLLGPLTQEVDPWQLPALTAHWAVEPPAPTDRPSYDRFAEVIQPMYESESVPLNPARAALHLSGACPDGGVVVADAGWPGFWLARTFPTSQPGSVVVPATFQPGFAAAAALAAVASGRPAIAVTDDVDDPATEAILELSAGLGLSVTVQAWVPDGPATSPDEHAQMSTEQLGAAGASQAVAASEIIPIGVDLDHFDALEALAGPVSAWGGLRRY